MPYSDHTIKTMIIIMVLVIAGSIFCALLIPLLLVLSGWDVFWLLSYGFLWPLWFVVLGVLAVNEEEVLATIKQRLR